MPETSDDRKPNLIEAGAAIDAAIQESVWEALLRHKREGNSVVVWRNGEMVSLRPEEIVIPLPGEQEIS
jgi:hypothetical protein